MKTLALMRHAKSSWKHGELSDFERPLNKRGLRDAPDMGRRLARRQFAPDSIITSPAQRAVITARLIASEVGFPLEQILQAPDFYLASPDTLVDGVREADDRNQTLMLFGHNPGFTFLANSLGDLTIDNMPTCSIATFEFDIERWRDLDYGCGKLAFFDYPKNTDKA